jgi:hypothetical protein
MLKGYLWRKLIKKGDDDMFGKKKQIDMKELEEMKKKIEGMQQVGQPAYTGQPQFQPPVPQAQFPQQPIPIAQPLPPPEILTPFCISERATTQVAQMIPAGSGQLVPTGQMETKEVIKIVYNLSLEDLIAIVANTPEKANIHVKVKELLKRMIK